MKFILGTKKEMTQIFSNNGDVLPVTVIEAAPCVITMIKKKESGECKALQIGCGERKKPTKPITGHLKKSGVISRHLQEFKYDSTDELKVGDKFGVEIFEIGNIVKVSGICKGKGFQGVVKRHGFAGSPASHGHKDQLRMPGSIGATDPAHVFKGKRMAGRMGGGNITVKNLEIVKIEEDKNLLYIKGAVPGPRNGIIRILGEGLIRVRKEQKKEVENVNEPDVKAKDELNVAGNSVAENKEV